jgi:fibro-slime domain-containing protein
MRNQSYRAGALVLALATVACGGDGGDQSSSAGNGAHAAGTGMSAGFGGQRASQGQGGASAGTGPQAGGAGAQAAGNGAVPADFTSTQVGGYALGGELSSDAAAVPTMSMGAGACSVISAVVRDFKGVDESGGHADFESFDGEAPTPGLVAATLGGDGKPVYASQCEGSAQSGACPYGQMTSNADNFGQWYRTIPGVNRAYALFLQFEPNNGVQTFQSNDFFPLDGAGFAPGGAKRKGGHNFHFTTEVHARFLYSGGERFSFTGDDDLWVFVNGRLAIDLGGLHPPASNTLDLDGAASALGILPGQQYALDLFHAERHTEASNFRVDTTLAFTNCGAITPD